MFFCFIDYTKAFDCLDHNKLWKILKEMGIPDHLTCLLRNLYADKEATEPDTEQLTGSKLGKEYNKAVYCQPVYSTYSQNVVVQLLSHVRFFVTPWTSAHQASLSFTISQSLLKLMSIDLVMPSNHHILCCPLLLLPSQHQGLF